MTVKETIKQNGFNIIEEFENEIHAQHNTEKGLQIWVSSDGNKVIWRRPTLTDKSTFVPVGELGTTLRAVKYIWGIE